MRRILGHSDLSPYDAALEKLRHEGRLSSAFEDFIEEMNREHDELKALHRRMLIRGFLLVSAFLISVLGGAGF